MPVTQFEAAAREDSTVPSGLAVVSTVTAQTRTLAIDQAGTRFLVKTQEAIGNRLPAMAGATEVRLRRQGPAVRRHGGPSGPPLPSAIFEM